MAGGNVSASWDYYLDAIEQLYGASRPMLLKGGAELAKLPPEPDRETTFKVDTVLKRSAEMRWAIMANLGAEGTEQRELAMLQLAAAAVADLGIAHDLARLAPETDPQAFTEPGLGDTLGEVSAILEAPPEDGLWSLIISGGAAAASNGPAEALVVASDAALMGIRDEAGRAATVTLGNPLEMLAGLPLQAANMTVGQLVGLVDGAISWVLRKAVEFVLSGIAKILALFGEKADAARAKVAEWATKPLGETAVVHLLDRLYGVGQASADFRAAIVAAPAGHEARMRAATAKLENLETKFRRQMRTIAKVAKAVGKVSPWLLAATSPVAPWAHLSSPPPTPRRPATWSSPAATTSTGRTRTAGCWTWSMGFGRWSRRPPGPNPRPSPSPRRARRARTASAHPAPSSRTAGPGDESTRRR